MGTKSNDYEGAFTNPTGTQQTQQAQNVAAQSSTGNGVPFDAERSYNNLLKTVASDKKKINEEIDALKKDIEELKKLKKTVEDVESKAKNEIALVRKDLSEKVIIERPTLFLAVKLNTGEFIKAEKPAKEEEIRAASTSLLAAANSAEVGVSHQVYDMYFYKASDGGVRDNPLDFSELKKEGII